MPETTAGEGLPEQAPERLSAKYPTRELGRLLSYYKKNIRDYASGEAQGVIRNIQRLIDKGIGLEDIAQALENYANDEWRKSQDPRYSLSVRSFFSEAKIKEWATPKPARPTPVKAALPEIDFQPLERPKPAIPQAAATYQDGDGDDL